MPFPVLSRRLTTIIVLVLLAFGLRVYNLGDSPLRGDEAFTVRYWAAPPAEVIAHLAGVEPHPLGAFFSFWAWKSLVGDSEFAMRMLPTLINLLGIPAIYGLALRLFRQDRIAALAGLFWAVNPYQIWHSQDVRNYAIWSALSVISLWLMLRAVHHNRRIDWALYVLAALLSLYMFFIEAFIMIVHSLYILIFHRQGWRPWLLSMLILAVLLIPWFAQIWALAHSGYGGSAAPGNLSFLWTLGVDFTFGPTHPDFTFFEVLLFNVVYVISLLFTLRHYPRAGSFLTLLVIVPSLLLVLVGTKINVLQSRYLIAIMPALFLPFAVLFSDQLKKRA